MDDDMLTGKIRRMHEFRQQHEDPLNLRSLPLVAPEQDDWAQIEAALRRSTKRKTLAKYSGGALAAAAAVTLAIGLYLGESPTPTGQSPATAQPELASVEAPAPSAASTETTLTALIGLSQKLEDDLRLYRAQMGQLPADALVYRVELEDVIAQVDNELNWNPESIGLWSQRVNLLLDLSNLYENNLRREYRQMASL